MLNAPAYFYGIAAAVYLTTCLVVAAVRWFHVCRPYDEHPDYYFPGRPFFSGNFLSAVVILPYIINPESPDALYLMRVYFLPMTLYELTLMLFAYFGNVLHWNRWQLPTIVTGLPASLASAVALVLALIPGEQVVGCIASEYVLHLLSGFLTLVCFVSVYLVFRWARGFDDDEFSNPSDIPVLQARSWMFLLLAVVGLLWAGALTRDQLVLSVMMLIYSVIAVAFLLSVLHPKRTRPYQPAEPAGVDASAPEETPAPEEEAAPRRNISPRKVQDMLAAINTVVVEQKAFLEPHLTIQDVADRCGYSRSYIASLMKSELGGFFNYVNRYRVRYLKRYLREYPGTTVQEAAEESGFSSRQAYYAIRKKLVNSEE